LFRPAASAPAEKGRRIIAAMEELRRDHRGKLSHLEDTVLEMGNLVLEMVSEAMAANKGLFRRLVQLAATDETRLDWAMRTVLVARYLERLGDHAGDIGEQVIFLVTGDYVELASNSPLD
jgi:phosphate uptake regulator